MASTMKSLRVLIITLSLMMIMGSPCTAMSSTIAHSREPFSLPPYTPPCIYTGLQLFIGSLSNLSSYPVGSTLERKVACGYGHENVLLRLRLLNANGTHMLPSNADDAKVIINGQALRDKFRSLVEDLMPTLDLRYRWGIAMSGHYWIEYHTVGAASHVLSKKETIASTSHVHSKKKPIASTSHVLSKKTGPIPSTDKKTGNGRTAHMTDTVADSRSKKNGGMKLPKNKVGDGTDQLKAGNHVVGSSSDGVMSRFSNGGDVAGSCSPRGDVLVSHTRGGAGGDEGFEVLTAPKSLISQNNQYYMRMEGDCRLVLYRTASGETLWSSAITVPSHQTLPKEYGQLSCSLSLLSDGTLVITDGSDPDGGAVVWSSRSSSASSENPSYCPSIFIFILQDDGNAVVYNMLSGLPIWATGTNR